jgi:hypothetical protein
MILKKKEVKVMDNWKHRYSGMVCTTCMFFVAKALKEEERIVTPTGDIRGRLGRCRRYAPTMRGFPAVFATDWCGEHKLDENKL